MQTISNSIRTPENNRKILTFLGYSLVTPEMRRRPQDWKQSYWQRKQEGKGTEVVGTDDMFQKENGITIEEIHHAYDLIANRNSHGFGTVYIPDKGYVTTITKDHHVIAVQLDDNRKVSMYGALIQFLDQQEINRQDNE